MKIQNEMATRISVDAVSAIGSMKAFRDAVTASGNAWRAQESTLKSSGQYYEALKSRISGLNQQIELQKAKVSELRQRQEGLDRTNQKQATQWLNLEKQISQANKQLAGYEGQLEKATSKSSYYSSGLAGLQHQMRMNSEVSKSYVASLRAQGNISKANRVELDSLTSHLANLRQEETKQKALLKQISQESGKNSDAYKRQQIELNKTRETMAQTDSRMKQLKSEMSQVPTSGITRLKQHILQVDNAEQKAGKSALNFKKLLASSVIGGAITAGLNTITSNFTTIISQGMQAAKVGAAMESRWRNIGVSARGVKQLSAQVTDLKTNTNLTAQSVNALQTRFYGMTHSISKTKTLTKGVASLSDQLKLSDKQANAFASGLSRIESSGKVTSMSLGRLEKQAPGLTAAMAKASGMSSKAFKSLVASGKMTSAQFNQILAKASKDYDKNSKAFGETSGGALHKLQQEWISTQAKLAKPLLKVSATGLNELSKSLNDKNVQKGIAGLATGMAKIAIAGTKVIGVLAKYSGAVKVAAISTAVLWGYFKTARLITNFSMGISKLIVGIKGVSNAEKAAAITQKALNVAMKANAIVLITTAIAALVIGLRELYKHNAKFRKFCNDLGKIAKNAGKAIVKGFKAVVNFVKRDWKQIGLFLVNPIAGSFALLYKHNKKFRKFVNTLGKDAKKGLKKVTTAFSSLSRNVGHTSKSMWRKASRDARNGWNYVVRWGKSSSKGVAKDWNWMNRQTTKVARQMFKKHKQTFKAGYKVLEDQTRTWKDLTSGHWDRLFNDTQRTANDMNKFHQRLFRDMYKKLNDMTGGRLGDMVKAWQDKMSSIGDTVANAKQAIHTHFVDLVRGIIKPFNDMLGGIQKGINWVLDKIGASKIGGNWQVPMPSYATGTLGAHPGGFAKVNDGKTGHYREMYKLPNGVVGMFPAVRDMIVPLPKGTSILDGEKTYSFMRMMGKIPHYATGTLDAVGNFFGNLKDDVESFMDNIDKFIDHPVELMESVFKKFIRVSTPIKFATDMIQHFPVYVAQQMKNWLKKQLEEFSGPNGGAASEGLIRRAAAMMHVHPSDAFIHNLMQVIMNESGNRSVMQTIHDMNSGGNEAGGILQYTPGTFATYAMPGHTNRMNPLDELLAFFNNSDWENSIGWTTIWGHRKMEWLHSGPQGHRRLSHFANGGLVNRHQLIEIAEGNKPEYVIPTDISKRSRAYQLLGEIIARFHADEPAQTHINSGYGKKIDQLNAKFDRLLDMFGQLLGATDNQTQAIQAQGSLDTKQLYKKMARDKTMRQFG